MNNLLRKMSKEEFVTYFENKVARYAVVLSENSYEYGNEDFYFKARTQLNNLLPKGVETPNHHLFNLNLENQVIGYVWIKVEKEKKSAFLYEIYIFEKYRGKGLGTEVMTSVEAWLEQEDIHFLKLHVFGSNTRARKLYEELGFEIAGINMVKTIN